MILRNSEEHLLIAQLIIKSIKNELTDEEKIALDQWIKKDEKNRQLFNELSEEGLNADLQKLAGYDISKAQHNVMHGIRKGKVVPWMKYAASAAAAVLIYFAIDLFTPSAKQSFNTPLATNENNAPNDVKAPESVNAVLTLGDGSTLVLDSLVNGQIAHQGNTNINKLADGKLVYNGEAASVVQYNTLTVPRGSKIVELTLTDGTKVVMNAASAITFPTVFAGDERKVTITGEAYFEVAHDKSKPFIVSKGDAQIEVLGTHFNVNAYDDEEAINVTLLQGSVRVTKLNKKQNLILKPGQMARITSKLELLPEVNINEVMAWKEGKFRFGEFASIETVMRQLSRWYDVEVEYKGKVSGHIGGTIERAANISQVLHILEMTGIVKFNIQGRKIIVMPR